MFARIVLLCVGAACLPALPAAADSPPVAVHLVYDGYTPHLHALRLETELLLAPSGYRIVMEGHTTGMVGFFYHADWRTWADGVWRDSGIAPLAFDNSGTFGGQRRHVIIDFANGQPLLRMLQPSDDGEHLPVDPALTQDAIDSLSLTALVVRQIATLGHCEGQVRVYDGRQAEIMALRAAGAQDLLASDRSAWRGPTLRCNLQTRVVSGFVRNDSARLARTFTDAIWLGTLFPGVPPLPVRFTATTHRLGQITMYLRSASQRGAGEFAATHP